MMQPLSETQPQGTLNQAWPGQVLTTSGASNGVGLQQVNPSPNISNTAESGSSLPILTPLDVDMEFLQSNGPAASQPRQDQQNQQPQQAQQPPPRRETALQGIEGTPWFNTYGFQQPQSTQNGATGAGGSLGVGYSYTDSLDDEFLQNLMGNNQQSHQLKQESSSMAMLGPTCTLSSDCTQSFTALLNCPNTNGSTQEAMRQMETAGSSQRGSQVLYPTSGIGQDNQLDWHY